MFRYITYYCSFVSNLECLDILGIIVYDQFSFCDFQKVGLDPHLLKNLKVLKLNNNKSFKYA